MTRDNIEKLMLKLDIEPLGVNNKGWVLARCPFAEWTHASGEDKNPDFWIKSETNKNSGFHCFACHQKGPIQSLVKRLEIRRGVSYGTLYVEAALLDSEGGLGDYEVSIEDEVEPEPINPTLYGFQEAWHSDGRAYLEQRGISEQTCKLLMLKYDPDTKRIVFPVTNDVGNVFGFTGRTTLGSEHKVPKVKDYPGLRKEKFLLGEHLVVKGRPFWVVEGLFALAHMIEIGLHNYFNVVALMGASLSKFQRDILIYYNQPAYLCLDDDLGGTQGLFGPWNDKLANFSGGGIIDQLKEHLPTMVPVFPSGITDPDNLTLEQALGMSKNVKLF